MNEKSPLERKCVNCARVTTKGIHCKTCDAVWFIAERIESYHADPIVRMEFIEEMKRKSYFNPAEIFKVGKDTKARKFMILGHQLTGFCIGFVNDEITNLMSRGYNLAKRNTEHEIERVEEQSNAYQAGRAEVEKLHAKIKQESKVNLGHLGDGLNFSAYIGFDTAATDTEEVELF